MDRSAVIIALLLMGCTQAVVQEEVIYEEENPLSWTLDLTVNFTIGWEWEGDNISFSIYRNESFFFARQEEGSVKIGNGTRDYDWPVNQSTVNVNLTINSTNDYYDYDLGYNESVRFTHEDSEGTLIVDFRFSYQ